MRIRLNEIIYFRYRVILDNIKLKNKNKEEEERVEEGGEKEEKQKKKRKGAKFNYRFTMACCNEASRNRTAT